MPPGNPQNLKDISKRADFKEITSRGGKNVTPEKQYNLEYQASIKAKCKNCPVRCDYKQGQIERDPEAQCLVPSARVKAIRNNTGISYLNRDWLEGNLKEVTDWFIEQWTKAKDEKEKKRWAFYINKHGIDLKQNFVPEVTKQINLNINTTTDDVMKRIAKFKDKQKLKQSIENQQEQIIVEVNQNEETKTS